MRFLAEGVSAASPLIDSISTTSKFLSITASFATVGALLAMGFLLFDKDGFLTTATNKLRTVAWISALIWFTSSSVLVVATLANILGTSIGGALDLNSLRSFLTQVTLGQYMFFQTLTAVLVGLAVLSIKKTGGAIALLILSLAGIIAPVFQSHSASSGSHALAIGSLAIHVIALAFWVGGLIAISLLNQSDRAVALPRFSVLALWAAIAVVLSGSANAWARLNFAAAWESGYAKVVVVKILLTAILIFFGYKNRKFLQGKSKIDI